LETIEGSFPGLVCVTIDIYLEEGENKRVRFYGTVNVSDYVVPNSCMIRRVCIKAIRGVFQEGL